MKKLIKLPICICFIIILVSCTTDSSNSSENLQDPVFNGGNPTNNNSNSSTNVFFGFLDGDGSYSTYIDMPIESSSTNSMIGRWQITKLGVDENNDGNIIYYSYNNFDHGDCGLSFLQFNNDGTVFENCYYESNGTCTLYSEIDSWELIGDNLKIYVYDNIFVVSVTESELILKYDWIFENSLWAPMQAYYYYERFQASN